MAADDLGRLYQNWLFDVWYGDLTLIQELFAPDFVGHWPGQEVYGPDGVASQIEMSRQFFSDIENSIDVGPIVGAETVAAHWTFSGTYQGGIPGSTAAIGTRVSFRGSDIMQARDGKFVEYWTVSDTQSFANQLGLAPA
jgi:predicted ester cyclase